MNKTIASYPVSKFLSASQIKEHRLEGHNCYQSLEAKNASNIFKITDENNQPTHAYIEQQKNRNIVKYSG